MITHYFFGDFIETEGAPQIEEILKRVRQGNVVAKENIAYEDVLDVFSKLYSAWNDPNYSLRVEAIKELKRTSGLGDLMVEKIFENFPQLMNPEIIAKKMQQEFGSSDAFSSMYKKEGSLFSYVATPVGTVLHIAPSNTFLGSIDSLINGMITLNVNFMKMSDADTIFPLLFIKSIEEFDTKKCLTRRLALLWWKGGDENVEKIFKNEMDRIIFFGGFFALSSWQKGIGPKTLLVPHGPKVSFGIVSKKSLQESNVTNITDRIAFDISIWEQKACNCPQTIFVENLDSEEGSCFLESLSASLERVSTLFPPLEKSKDEYVELLKTTELAIAGDCLGEKNKVFTDGDRWRIIAKYKEDNDIIYSPLNRTIYVTSYSSFENVAKKLSESSFYLQTAGYSLTSNEFMNIGISLAKAGVTRLCPFGKMTIPEPGTPHDGKYLLHDLARVTVIE